MLQEIAALPAGADGGAVARYASNHTCFSQHSESREPDHVTPFPAVIAVFPGGESGDEFEAYRTAANSLRGDYDFGHTTDASLLAEANGTTVSPVFVLPVDNSSAHAH